MLSKIATLKLCDLLSKIGRVLKPSERASTPSRKACAIGPGIDRECVSWLPHKPILE